MIVTVLAASQVSTKTLASISCFFTCVAKSIGILTSPLPSVWADPALVEFTTRLIVELAGAFLTYSVWAAAVPLPANRASAAKDSGRNDFSIQRLSLAFHNRSNCFAFPCSNLRSITLLPASRRMAAIVCDPWQRGPVPS